MLRLLKITIFLAVVVLIIVGIYFWTARVSIMERMLSKQLNTEVTLKDLKIGWRKLSIRDLKIANPKSATLPLAFQVGEVSVAMSPFELLHQTIHIDRIDINNPTISLELYNKLGTDNNWVRLLNNMSDDEGKEPKEEDVPQKKTVKGDKTKFVIRKLTLSNLKFDVIRSDGTKLAIPPLTYLELDNIGEKGPLGLSEVGNIVFQVILSTLKSQADLKDILENVKAIPQSFLKNVKTKLQDKETRKAIQKEVDTFKKKGSKILEDLFSN